MQRAKVRLPRFGLLFHSGHAAPLTLATATLFVAVLHASTAQAACTASSSSASANGGSTCNVTGSLSGGSPALSSTGAGSVLNGATLTVMPASGGGGIAAIASGGGIINLDFPSGSGSTITLNGGGGQTGLEATGAGSAINANNLTFTDNAQVSTPGLAWATAGGTITLTNSTITSNVSGGEAGLEADTGGTINATNTNIIFGPSAGGGHVGVKTTTGSTINMTGGSVQIENGGGNLGLYATGGTINGSGVAITVGNSGGGAGIEATGSGIINLTNDSTITTSGAGTPGGELINGGTINMTGGTVTTRTVGSDGFLATNGGATDTLNLTGVTINAASNSFHVNNGSTADMALDGVTAVVNNGTVLLTEGGGTANMTASNSTFQGVMTTAGGSTANVVLQDDTTWTMTGNSNVTNLTNNDSVIDYTAPVSNAFKTLTTNNYTGTGGAIGLNTFLGTDGSPSDLLVINGGTGTGSTILRITNADGGGAMTTSNGILVVQAANGATTSTDAFTLGGAEVRAGAFNYYLFHGGIEGNDPQSWYLRSSFTVPSNPTPLGPTVPTLPPAGITPIVPPTETTPATPLPPGLLPPGYEVTPGAQPPVTALPSDPPPGDGTGALPPGTYPIIGPEIGTYDTVEPLARESGTAMLGTLHDRIGDLSEPCGSGALNQPVPNPQPRPIDCVDAWVPTVWARTFGQSIDNHYLAFADPRASGDIIGFQAGVDWWRGSLISGHRDAFGTYVAYANTAADVTGLVTNAAATGYVLQHTGSVDIDGWSAGGYWTHWGPQGWYLDAVAQGTFYRATAATQNTSLNAPGTGLILSLEGGYPIPLPFIFGPNFVLEPQGQILWQQIHFDAANDSFGEVALGTTSGESGRLGLRGRWTIESGNGQIWQPFVHADLWQDWGGSEQILYSGIDSVPVGEENRHLELGGGLTVKINHNASLYARGDYQFAVGGMLEGMRREAEIGQLGFRYDW